MKKRPVILIGAGGHCHSVIDVIESEGKYDIKGLIDLPDQVGDKVYGYPIIASDDQLPEIIKEFPFFLITIGQEKLPLLRVKSYNNLERLGAEFVTVISPFARVSRHSFIGRGTVVLHHALINAGVKIGKNCIINSGALVEHDCIIGDHVQISTAAILNGNIKIDKESFIGSNSVLKQGINIGERTIVGAGTVVTKSFGSNLTLVGNPAKNY